MSVGRFKDKELRFIPSWYLKFLVKNWNDKEIREGAREVLEVRSRLGIEKPKSKAKKPVDSQIEPRKREILPVSFIADNANVSGSDAF